MLEKTIVTALMRYLKTVPRCFCWKQHGGAYSQKMDYALLIEQIEQAKALERKSAG